MDAIAYWMSLYIKDKSLNEQFENIKEGEERT